MVISSNTNRDSNMAPIKFQLVTLLMALNTKP